MLQILIDAINLRSGQRRTLCSKLEPTGNQQDCGMTPLHNLMCSSVHDLELYHVIVENYPTNLITEDGWGALPTASIVCILWSCTNRDHPVSSRPLPILYPNHEFNWTMMVETMGRYGRCDTRREIIENLLLVKQMHFPEQIECNF